jgi:alkanesulfonate monooxygenase SsuD/methylene tetrahydromethanopterin reductase-like flavin-dependent oxidoreductase (luciferase family)
MHFGQFNLMGYRTPGAKAHELYDSAVEQVRAAEANGFEIAWFAEHHFSNYCVCPSPLMMLARLAGESKRIKLGSAVVVTPLYQPVRLISEIGMVDALTHGRLVLGVGSGYQPYEFERFGEDLQTRWRSSPSSWRCWSWPSPATPSATMANTTSCPRRTSPRAQ